MPCSAGLLHFSALKLATVGHSALSSKIAQENEGLQLCYRSVCLSTSSKFEGRMRMVRMHVSTYAEGQERTLGRVLKGGGKKPLKLRWAAQYEGILQQHLLRGQNWREISEITSIELSLDSSSPLLETQPFTSLQIPLAFPYCDVQIASEHQHLAETASLQETDVLTWRMIGQKHTHREQPSCFPT